MVDSKDTSFHRRNRKLACHIWNLKPNNPLLITLKELSQEFGLSVLAGHLILLQTHWYVTHAGLLNIAQRNRCRGIQTQFIPGLSDTISRRFAFKATVFKHGTCKGFVAYGDADPSNVSPQLRGAEMRVAETRATNRALRKAYGIGVCSVEEIGSFAGPGAPVQSSKRIPPQPVKGNSHPTGSRVRDRLCQTIREHKLDPGLVKSYAVAFCGTKVLRDATREQVENFATHLADWAEKDRNALLRQLNTFIGNKEGAA